MKNFIKARPLSFIAAVMAVMLTMSSCNKEGDAPTLPPSEGFAMDMSFNDGDTAAAQKTSGYANWGYSATGVVFWNAVLTIQLAVPVASYAAAFDATPSYDRGEEKWIWSYDVKVGLVTYTCDLKGAVEGDEVNWEMYISNNAGDNFLWYQGTSALDGSSARWQLNKAMNNGTPYMQIDWLDNGDGTSEITYSIIETGTAEGSYITFAHTDGTDYDRYYNLYGAAEDNLIQIQWNSASANGRVSSEQKFGTTDWQCWNESLVDIDCL